MEFNVLPDLTKGYILNHITQEQIFERYLSIPVDTVNRVPVPSFLRYGKRDDDPSGTFKWSGQKLRFRDWAGNFWGDCFDVVGTIEGVDGSTKLGFVKILERIARDFGLHKYSGNGGVITDIPARLIPTGETENRFKVFKAVPRAWNVYDAKFWTKYYTYKPALDYFDVIPCNYILRDNQIVYEYDERDPAYAYYWGKDIKGRELYKFYFPYRDKKKTSRFWMNCSVVEGINKFQPAEIGVITKSYKDVICLKCIIGNEFSISSISPPSESTLIPPDAYQLLWANCDYVVSLMDFDFQGMNMAWKLKTKYNIPPLFLTNGKRGTKTNFGSKDFSDYVAKNGKDKALFLIDQAQKYIRAKFEKIDKPIQQ